MGRGLLILFLELNEFRKEKHLKQRIIVYSKFQKFGAMDQVAHQTIAMQYLLELSKQLDVDPRACISSFFSK